MYRVNQHIGRKLIVVASIAIVFVLGFETIVAQRSTIGDTSPTLEPWELTITSVMAARTAYSTLNTPISVTTTPNLAPVYETISDPLELTATFIVAAATTSGSMGSTPSPTATPEPTYTVAQLAKQKTEYINKLVSTVGFDHPVFEEIANNLLVGEVSVDRYIELEDLDIEMRTTTFAKEKYLVLIIHPARVYFDRLLIFRFMNQDPVLVDNPPPIASDSFIYIGFDDKGFVDWNSNGLPDIVIYTSYGGNCCLPRLNLLELESTDHFVDISPQTIRVYPASFKDLNKDGIPEIKGLEPGSGMSSVDLVLWYGWDGQQYVNVSAQYPELYLPRITAFVQRLSSVPECHLKGINNSDSTIKVLIWYVEIENVLADYYAIGQLSEGWIELQQLLKENCSKADLQIYGKWLTTIDNAVKRYSKS